VTSAEVIGWAMKKRSDMGERMKKSEVRAQEDEMPVVLAIADL
jgi:hypothetical protein